MGSLSGRLDATRIVVWGGLLIVLGLGWRLVGWQLTRNTYHPRPVSCVANLKQLSLAVQMYATDYDERMPRVANWHEVTVPFVKNEALYHCPEAQEEPWVSYGMNCELSGRVVAGISSDLVRTKPPHDLPREVLLFDGRHGTVIERHNDGANYSFADGHATWLEDPPAGIPVLNADDEGEK